MWGCIHKMFRCPASCVLLLRTNSRDYFLVGENSWETNGWSDVLYNVLQGQKDVRYDQDVDVGKPRTCSAPPVPRTEQTHQASDREAKSKSMPLPLQFPLPLPLPSLSQPVNRPVCLMPPYRPNTQVSLIEATGPSAAEEPIYAVPSSLPVIAALQNVDEGPRRTQSEPPKSWTNKKTELTYDKKVRPKSMPLPPSLPRETNPARLYAVHEKPSPQVPKSDENEEGADCGMYEDMATLCNAAMMAEDKEPPEDVDSEDSDFVDYTHYEMEVCVSREDLEKHLDLTSDGETPGRRDSLLLKGDEILAINNLHIDSEKEVEFMLKKLRVNEVTVTIRRLSSEFQAMKAEPSSM
ncbi:uncharacterized protein LOC134069577 isoform X2 [Sardina pilchardus]